MTNEALTEQEQRHLIEVYKTMWQRVDNIDRMDLTFIAVPPTVVGLMITWFTLLPQVDPSKVLLSGLLYRLVDIMALFAQLLVGVTALIMLRSYVDHARAISNIAAVELALGISRYIPKRLSLKLSKSRYKFAGRIVRSSKGLLFVFYNILPWGIAVVFNDCGHYLAAALLQSLNLGYVWYYVYIFPSEDAKNKEESAPPSVPLPT